MPSTKSKSTGNDDGWTFTMHDGFVTSSEGSSDEGPDLPIAGQMDSMSTKLSNNNPAWVHRGLGNGRNDEELDLSAREDSAVFQRNPWSIAKLNASTRNQVFPAQSSPPAPNQKAHPGQSCRVIITSNGREKERSSSKTGPAEIDRQRVRQTVVGRQDRPPASRPLPKAFPIIKAFQNCRSKSESTFTTTQADVEQEKLQPQTSQKEPKTTSNLPSRDPISATASEFPSSNIPGTNAFSDKGFKPDKHVKVNSLGNKLEGRLKSLSYSTHASEISSVRALPSSKAHTCVTTADSHPTFSFPRREDKPEPDISSYPVSVDTKSDPRPGLPFLPTPASSKRLAAFRFAPASGTGFSDAPGNPDSERNHLPSGAKSSPRHDFLQSGLPSCEEPAVASFLSDDDFVDELPLGEFPSSEMTMIGSTPVKPSSPKPRTKFPALHSSPTPAHLTLPASSSPTPEPAPKVSKGDAYQALTDDEKGSPEWSTLPSRSRLSLKGRFDNPARNRRFPTLAPSRITKFSGSDSSQHESTSATSVRITSHALPTSRRRLTVYHPPPKVSEETVKKESTKPPMKIVRSGDSRVSIDEERLRRLLARSKAISRRTTPEPAGHHDHPSIQHEPIGENRDPSTYTSQRISTSKDLPSPPPSSPIGHVDVAGLTETYPAVRRVLSERKSAAAEAWDALDLPSCGVIWPDGHDATGLDDQEMEIMTWGAELSTY